MSGSGGARRFSEVCFSVPLAAHLGPGAEAMAEKRAAGWGAASLRL